jgi:hypothetical protein
VPQLGNWNSSNAVRALMTIWGVITDKHFLGIDPAGSDQLPRVGCDGVLATEHHVRVQVYSQRN